MREYFDLVLALLLLLCVPVIGIWITLGEMGAVMRIIGSLYSNFVFTVILFISGYVYVRRCKYAKNERRFDLAWKSMLIKNPGRHAQGNMLIVLTGILVGLVMCFLSLSYFELMLYYYPDMEVTPKAFKVLPKAFLIYTIMIAPFWEEIFYRWYLLNALRHLFRDTRYSRVIAIVLSSTVWAFAHNYGYTDPAWIKEVQIFLNGLILSIMYPRIGLEGCIIAHLTINMLAITPMLLW